MTGATSSSDELRALADMACNGALTEHEIAHLEQLLYDDVDAQRFYLDRIAFDTWLQWEVADQVEEPMPPRLPVLIQSVLSNTYRTTINFFSQELPFSLLIATVLTSLGLWFASQIYISNPGKIAENSSSLSPVKSSVDQTLEIVGKITGMANCKWSNDGQSPAGYDNVLIGRQFKLDSGLMEITYGTGAKVLLQGPVTYRVDSHNGGFLAVGKLTARLEKREKGSGEREKKVTSGQWPVARKSDDVGSTPSLTTDHRPLTTSSNPQSLAPVFAVRTPTATVTDLGTEFGVDVDRDGATQTVVFVGEVLASPVGQNASHEKPIHLSSGDAASIDSTQRIKTINGKTIARQFVRSIIAGDRGNRPNEQGFSFSESFRVPGIQAKTDGAFLAHYPLWTFRNDASDKASFVTVEPTGRLALMHPGKGLSNPTITIPAKAISGKPKFDVSRRPLTISIKMGARGTSPGWFDARLWLGEMLVDLYPEYGAICIRDRTGEKVFEEGYAIRQNEMCSLVLTVMENGGKYKCNIAYSDDSGVSTSKTCWIPKENAGELDRLSLGCQHGCSDSAAFFSDLSVVQEPY